MIKRMIRKWLGIEARSYPEPDTYEEDIKRNYHVNAALNESAPAVTAYKVSNGYIVRTMDRTLINTSMKMPSFTYCKDAQAIAEHIVAEAARQTMGIGHQYVMFQEPTKAVGQQTIY